MPNLTDDLKNTLSSIISGVGDVASTVQNVARENIVKLLHGAGDVTTTGLQKCSSLAT